MAGLKLKMVGLNENKVGLNENKAGLNGSKLPWVKTRGIAGSCFACPPSAITSSTDYRP